MPSTRPSGLAIVLPGLAKRGISSSTDIPTTVLGRILRVLQWRTRAPAGYTSPAKGRARLAAGPWAMGSADVRASGYVIFCAGLAGVLLLGRMYPRRLRTVSQRRH